MLTDPTEYAEVEELNSEEYDWLCDDCFEIFDGTYANFPQDGVCDPCLAKRIAKTPTLVDDIPF